MSERRARARRGKVRVESLDTEDLPTIMFEIRYLHFIPIIHCFVS